MSLRAETAKALRLEADILEVDMRPNVGLMRYAADLLDPPDDVDTIEVRVRVRVVEDENGCAYEARGDGFAKSDQSVQHRNPAVLASNMDRWNDMQTLDTWITARVPRPGPVGSVEGTVD